MEFNVYIHRRNKRMKQKEVAAALGIHTDTYCKKERGLQDFTIREGRILAEILDSDLNELFSTKEKIKG